VQPRAQQSLTCPTCGCALEKTPAGGLHCPVCLLRVGLVGEGNVTQDSTPNDVGGDKRFGVYEIDSHPDGSLYELGRGGMGVTYRATDTSLQRKVALKIIKIDFAERSADARERFVREARAAASLRHENIATIHQFGMRLETGQYFYAMELIEGETLEERVRRAGPLDARTTIKIAQQVTSALAAAEKHGLVHRDLKPANLMLVSRDSETAHVTNDKKLLVKIIDFGLAKAIHTQIDPKSLTHDRFVGTPAFASPEQFEHAALDVRSDIYSLSETLWFALTGKTPFSGHSVEEIQDAQRSNVLPVEQLKAAHVPSRLRSLLESMLAFEPASRPGTSELAARLQRCSPEARSVRHTRVAFAAAAFVILSMSALFVFQPSRIRNSPLNPDKSIAVLPFENRSEDKANAYFADGIHDEILTRLSKIADLKVISRTSTQQYQSRPANLREIAKQLGVTNFLEGSVQKVGERVRINVQLIRAGANDHLWAEIYDRNLADIFAVQSEVATAIANTLLLKLTGHERTAVAQKPTDNLAAYDAYLRGLDLSSRPSQRPEDQIKANVLGIQDRHRALMLRAEDALVQLITAVENARKSGLDDESDVDLNEDEGSGGSYQVASAAGMARLAPNGLLKQNESVDVACLKPSLVRVLKTIEGHYGRKMMVTSGYRDPARNRRANGAKNSLHMYCAAADIQVPGVSKWELASYLRTMPGRGGVGTYCHTESVHVDVGPERDWNWRCRRRS